MNMKRLAYKFLQYNKSKSTDYSQCMTEVSLDLARGLADARVEVSSMQHEDESNLFQLFAPYFRDAMGHVDEFLGLDCSFLIVRSEHQPERLLLVNTTSAENTVFQDEHLTVSSEFLLKLTSYDQPQRFPLNRNLFTNDRLWEVIWQTVTFGPYAWPWSIVGIPLSINAPGSQMSELEVVGYLVMVGPTDWATEAISQNKWFFTFLAAVFHGAVDNLRILTKLETEIAWSSSEYLKRVVGAGRATVLHGMLAPLQLLEIHTYNAIQDISDKQPNMVRNRLNGIRSAIQEVKGCVGNFLSLAAYFPTSTQSTETIPYNEWISPAQVVKDVVEAYKFLAQKSGKTFVVRSDVTPTIPMKKDQFKLVISNLLHNAVKYGYPGTKIKIEFAQRPESPDFILDVTSYGIPIPQADQDRIFQLGYRTLKASAKQYAAGGVGLFIARRAAEISGGSLSLIVSEFEETTGEGDKYRNTFRFMIPVSRRHK